MRNQNSNFIDYVRIFVNRVTEAKAPRTSAGRNIYQREGLTGETEDEAVI